MTRGPEAPPTGWDWFDGDPSYASASDDLCRQAAACLQTPSGQELLRHLQRAFLDRRVPPSASDAELRHTEGQRAVVGHLLRLLERGRRAPRATNQPSNSQGSWS